MISKIGLVCRPLSRKVTPSAEIVVQLVDAQLCQSYSHLERKIDKLEEARVSGFAFENDQTYLSHLTSRVFLLLKGNT